MYLLLRADQRLKQNHEDVLLPAHLSTRTVPIGERFWADIEPGTCSNIAFPVSKRLSTLLRHGDLPREEDGEIFQHCTDPLGHEIRYLRALQGHSGRNLIDPSLKHNVLIPDNFFEYIYHTTCSTERIEVLSNKIACNHPSRHTPSFLYPESCCDGIWRNHGHLGLLQRFPLKIIG